MMTANLHDVRTVRARREEATTWLEIEGRDGNNIGLFMPYEVALAMAVAFDGATALEAARRADEESEE